MSEEQKDEKGFQMIEVLNTKLPSENGKPNEWRILDKSGHCAAVFHNRRDACNFLGQPNGSDVTSRIIDVCDSIKAMLLDKNRKYGDSALNPCRVFSKSDALEQIRVRMDDKLSRIRNAQADDDEDAYMDLAGYLVLYLVARGRMKQGEDE